MKVRSGLAAAALALAGAALPACATVNRSPPLRDFADGRYEAARAWYEADMAADPAAEILDRNELGTVALAQGDVAGAHRHFAEAYTGMDDLTSTTGESTGAILGPESSKTWKGDPYERCMNAYYLGVTYGMLGDPDNAAASFKQGLLRDADSEKGDAQSDFTLLWFLLGMAQREAAHEDRGAAALAKAAQLKSKNPWLDPAKAADANVLLVLDLGLGPAKVATGPHGSILRFVRRPYRASYADVTADGASLGRTYRAVEVFHQATTRGEKTIDHINQGKAVFKDAAVVTGAFVLQNSGSRTSDAIGAGLIVAGLLMPAESDLRQWDTLPGEVHVLTAKLEPGEHRLRVEVREASDAPMPEFSREIVVTVRPGHLTFVWTRATLPGQRRTGPPQVIGADRMEARP